MSKKTAVSSNYILQMFREFAIYSIEQRGIPSIADGLQTVGRRNLWKARSGKEFKTETLSGITMSIHPHGESSGPINTLAAYYGNNIPLFTGEGAFGTRLSKSDYGAARYTKVRVSEFTKDCIFADLDIVPMIPNYDHTEEEPAHFLPLVPVLLINPSEGMAVGYSSSFVPRHPQAIIEAQIAHLQGKPIDEETLVPEFLPIDSKSVDYKDTPKGRTYYFYGEFTRLSSTEIRVTKLPYGVKHSTVVETLDSLWDSGFIHSYVDDSTDQVDIVVKFQRGKLAELKDGVILNKLGLIGKESEIPVMLDFSGQRVLKLTTPEIISTFTDWRLTWYKVRYERLLTQALKDLDRLYDIRKAIDGDLGKHARTAKGKNELVAYIQKLEIKDVEYIAGLPVYRFTKAEYEENEKRIEKLEQHIIELDSFVSDENKRKKQYIVELKDILKNVKAGKYYPDIWYEK